MGIIDIAIFGLVFLSALIGIFRGFVREVLSLVAWVAAFYIAFRFHGDIAGQLTMIEMESLRKGAAFLAIFFVVLIIFSLFNYVVAKLVDSTGLSGTDRFLGVIFGVARGAAIVLVLIILAGLTPLPESKPWQKSKLIPYFQEAGEWVKGYLPEDIAKHLDFSTAGQTGEAEPNEMRADQINGADEGL